MVCHQSRSRIKRILTSRELQRDMIYEKIPEKFSPIFEVVSCYVECNGDILLLHRREHKTEGGKWGVPAGKVDEGETAKKALLREIREETGITLYANSLNFLSKICVTHDDRDFIYHMYKTILNDVPNITLRPNEHQNYKWIKPQKALDLNLVTDLDSCIKMYY